MAIDFFDSPSIGFESLRRILAVGKTGWPVDADIIVIIKHDQLRKAQMPGEGRTLVANALHQAAVSANDISVMVD